MLTGSMQQICMFCKFPSSSFKEEIAEPPLDFSNQLEDAQQPLDLDALITETQRNLSLYAMVTGAGDEALGRWQHQAGLLKDGKSYYLG